jgi:hypothetical protein
MLNPSDAARQHLKQLGIICFAIITGVVIFWCVVWYLLGTGAFTPPEGLSPFLASFFNLAALLALVVSFLLPRLFSPPPPGAPEEDLLARHKRDTILGFAVREGAAFIALFGVLLTGQAAGGFAMAGLAIVAMAFAWPRMAQLQEL